MISIIIPIIRPEKAARLIASIDENAGIPADQYEIITEVDHRRIGCPKMVKRLTEKAKYDLVCFLGDDTIMEPDCLKNAMAAMKSLPDGWGLVVLNDNPRHKRSDYGAHFLAHKQLLPRLAGETFFHTGYKHAYCDNELSDIAQDLGRYTFCETARLIHDHPINGSDTDPDYDRVYDPKIIRQDHRLYLDRKIAAGREKYAIGLPIVEMSVPVNFMISFLLMDKPDFSLMTPTFPLGSFAGNIADARNSLVREALNTHCTHIIMMDTDQIYPVGCIDRLISHQKPVVGTVVHRRWPPFDPLLFRGEPGKYTRVPDKECYSGDLVPVDATGTGCILFDLRLFMDLEMPWFEITKDETGKTIGEDFNLCARLRANGIPIYVDTAISINHMTTFQVNRATYELFKKLNDFESNEANE